MSVQVRTLSGDQSTIPDEAMEELRMAFQGPLIAPDDLVYNEVRVVQNGLFDRRPGLIVRCSGTADVVDAVNLARERDLLIAVRGGGHGIAGHSIADGAMMIDLSAMRGVWVNPETRTVRVQGGATWGDVDRETQMYGLAVPGGVVSTTGVAGLTLGGGIGWLHRKYGLACDNLRAAEVVSADGQVRRASESENPDLFWGLRGGGGNFGVVTAFEFEAYPVGPTVMVGSTIYPMDNSDEILRAWRDWTTTVPDEITTRAVMWWLPEDPHLPPEVHNKDVLITAAVYSGSVNDGERVVEPIRHLGTPLADLSSPMPYRVVQSLFDPFFPKGELSSYWKSVYLREVGDDAIELMSRSARRRLHPLVMIHIPMLGGAMSRVAANRTAFGDRSADYMLSVDGNWVDGEDSKDNIRWVREVVDEARFLPSAAGTYLNFSGDAELDGAERLLAFGDNLERLVRLKGEYDPDNRFRLNNNIPPGM